MGGKMLSRRTILIETGLAGVAALARPITSVFASAAQPKTPVNFNVPTGSCDCHTHIFGDPQKFPFAMPRVYTPETASIEEIRSLHRALKIQRVVIVHPTVYGTDDSCTLDAVKRLAPDARGIVVLGDNVSDADLDQMHRGGIRGVRINLETGGQSDPELARQRVKTAIERIKGRRWHIEIYTRLSVIEALKDQVMASPVPVSFDHFGGAQGALGLNQPGFDTLLSLVHSGKAYVKVSAPYRSSKLAPDYPDATPLAKALIAANPRRITWGSDWPHPAQIPGRPMTQVTPLFQIDDGRDLNQLATWTSSAAQLKLILAENPARLYGF
jgi:predicted TIM-barrel fold metal-dependent hydrolase